MKTPAAAVLALVATPVLAHPGSLTHTHDDGAMFTGVAVIIVALAMIALREYRRR